MATILQSHVQLPKVDMGELAAAAAAPGVGLRPPSPAALPAATPVKARGRGPAA